MHVRNRFLDRIAAAMLLVLTVSMLTVGPAAAAPPRGGTSGTSATLSVSTPVPGYFHAQGCGYVVGKAVNIVLEDATAVFFFPVAVNDSGCISFDFFSGGPGTTYVLKAYQNAKGNKQSLMASTTFTI